MGPALFSFGLSMVLREARRDMESGTGSAACSWSNGFQPAYLDDVHVVGDISYLARFMSAVSSAIATTGANLTMHPAKCKVWAPKVSENEVKACFGSMMPGYVDPKQGVVVLGAPIGEVQYTKTCWNQRVQNKTGPLIKELAAMGDVQTRLLLLRFCAVPVTNHMLRMSPPAYTATACKIHDAQVKKAVESVLTFGGRVLDTLPWQRAVLPMRLGGMGLTSATETAGIAYAASLAQAAVNLQDIPAVRKMLSLPEVRDPGECFLLGANMGRPKLDAEIAITNVNNKLQELRERKLTGRLMVPQIIRRKAKEAAAAGAAGAAGAGQGGQDREDDVPSQERDPRAQQQTAAPRMAEENLEPAEQERREALDDPIFERMATFPANLAQLISIATTPKRRVQHILADVYYLASFLQVFNDVKPDIRPKLVSQCMDGASDFLECIPFEPSLSLSNEVMRWNVLRWLGVDTDLDKTTVHCECYHNKATRQSHLPTHYVDPNHIDNCKVGGGNQYRHNNVVHTIGAMLHAARLDVAIEVRGELEGTGQGGPDIKATNFPETGETSIIEVAVVNPASELYRAAATTIPLHAADTMSAKKQAKYAEAARQSKMGNWQAIVESPGALGQGLVKIVKQLGVIAKRNGGQVAPAKAPWNARQFRAYWTQRLSVAVHKGAYEMALRIRRNVDRANRDRRERKVAAAVAKGAKTAGAKGAAAQGQRKPQQAAAVHHKGSVELEEEEEEDNMTVCGDRADSASQPEGPGAVRESSVVTGSNAPLSS